MLARLVNPTERDLSVYTTISQAQAVSESWSGSGTGVLQNWGWANIIGIGNLYGHDGRGEEEIGGGS